MWIASFTLRMYQWKCRSWVCSETTEVWVRVRLRVLWSSPASVHPISLRRVRLWLNRRIIKYELWRFRFSDFSGCTIIPFVILWLYTFRSPGPNRESALRAIASGTMTGFVIRIVSETIAIVEITLLRSTLVIIAILTTEIISMVRNRRH